MELELSNHEAEHVYLALTAWCDGYEEATSCTEVDPTLVTPEQMLDALDGIYHQHEEAVTVLLRLRALIEGESRVRQVATGDPGALSEDLRHNGCTS